MTVLQIISASIALITAIGGVFIAWEKMRNSIKNIENSLNDIKPDLKDIRERFGAIEDRVDTLWKDKFAPSHSPRQLNERGEDVLRKSGIKDIVDNNRGELIKLVRARGATNAYDAERAVEEVMEGLTTHFPNITEKLKDGAFNAGVDIGALLFIGSIYLRNQIFDDLGFSIIDLDKPKTD